MVKMIALADANAGISNNRRIRLTCDLVHAVVKAEHTQCACLQQKQLSVILHAPDASSCMGHSSNLMTHVVGFKMATMLPKMPVKAKRKMKDPEMRPASRKLMSIALGDARKARSVRTGSKNG